MFVVLCYVNILTLEHTMCQLCHDHIIFTNNFKFIHLYLYVYLNNLFYNNNQHHHYQNQNNKKNKAKETI